MQMTQSFKEIVAWQKAHAFVIQVYQACALFPAHERYGLCSQFERAAVSIAANIVEGYTFECLLQRHQGKKLPLGLFYSTPYSFSPYS